jgi:hypothetical protein
MSNTKSDRILNANAYPLFGNGPRPLFAFSLGFLGASTIRYENQQNKGWNSLDLLGFPRAKRDLSMGYDGKIGKSFSHRLFPGCAKIVAEVVACGKEKIFMRLD